MYSLAKADPPKSWRNVSANGVPHLESGGKTYRERTGGVSGGRPAGTTVQTHTLIGDDLEQTTATEGLGVRLTLDLQDIQRKQNDLSNTDHTRKKMSANALLVHIAINHTCQQLRA